MIIRKQFKFEACHCVRGCNSERCKKSFHGHSYVVEVFFQAPKLTDYGMVIDFGDLKKIGVSKLFDNFDHSWHFWNNEDNSVKDFICNHNQRWIELPFNPTAENYAAYFCKAINKLLKNNNIDNKAAICSSVRVHETATGWAEATIDDTTDIDDAIILSEETMES